MKPEQLQLLLTNPKGEKKWGIDSGHHFHEEEEAE